MKLTLTDDEIAAIAVSVRSPWPMPLPTIESTPNAIAAASLRGLRSLAVRGLIEGSDEYTIAPLIREALSVVQPTSGRFTTYVAERSAPSTLVGSIAVAYLAEDDGGRAIVEFVSPAGVHDLVPGSNDEARSLIVQLVQNTFDQGFRGEVVEDAALIVLGSHPQTTAAVVAQGSIEIGRMDEASQSFVPSEHLDTWDAAAIEAVLSFVPR